MYFRAKKNVNMHYLFPIFGSNANALQNFVNKNNNRKFLKYYKDIYA